ncbi:MAG: hypothetical protein WAL26_15250, partial [Mycobacterium sp.]
VVRPRQTATATVTTDSPVDKVTSATLEWGYTNFYRYRWAGRADSTAVEMNDMWWMMGEVGTDAGSEKDTDDWVGVTKVDLPIATGEFTGATSSFTVPSWAPGSSDALARWSARLTVERGGRDIDTRGDFNVVISADDLQVTDEPQRRAGGDGETELSFVLPSLVFRAGETIAGTIVLTPQKDMSDGELGVYWGYTTLSHPLGKTPAAGGGYKAGDRLKLGKGIPLRHGAPVSVPFALPTGGCTSDGLGGALDPGVVPRGIDDVRQVDPGHREGASSDRRRERCVVRRAISPTRRRPAPPSAALPCSARTVRRPAARSPHRR